MQSVSHSPCSSRGVVSRTLCVRGATLFLCFFLLSSPAAAQTTPTFGETAVGTACGSLAHGTDFDTVTQCNTSNASGGTKQKSPLFVGAVTAPPYAATTCDSNKAGMLQWDGTSFKGCTGTAWTKLQSDCAAFDPISFTNKTNIGRNQTVVSSLALVSGNSTSCTYTASCTGCTDIYKNGSSTGLTSGVSVKPGNTINLVVTSAATYNATVTATLTVGTQVSPVWSVTTMASDPCAIASPTVGVVCDDGTIYAGNYGGKMFTTRCPLALGGLPQDYDEETGTCVGNPTAYKHSTNATIYTANSTTGGESNTTTLATLSNADSPYSAAQACYNLNYNGQTDWYLPALYEAQTLCFNYAQLGNLDYVMTSTQVNATYVSVMDVSFSCATNVSATKTDQRVIRCVRK